MDRSAGKAPAPGDVVGRWTVIGKAPSDRHGYVRMHCRCACGTERDVLAFTLRNGSSSSCGCLSRELKMVHGQARGRKGTTREYQAWITMRRRCDPATKHPAYRHSYIERGIKVCPQWQDDFAQFFRDVGPAPSPHHSIDRINNDKGYEPGNVRWATRTEQQRNRRSVRLLTFNGETACIAEWSARVGIAAETISARIKRGWTVEQALTRAV